MFKDKNNQRLAIGQVVFYDNFPYQMIGKILYIDEEKDFPVKILCLGEVFYLRKHHLNYLEVIRKENQHERV